LILLWNNCSLKKKKEGKKSRIAGRILFLYTGTREGTVRVGHKEEEAICCFCFMASRLPLPAGVQGRKGGGEKGKRSLLSWINTFRESEAQNKEKKWKETERTSTPEQGGPTYQKSLRLRSNFWTPMPIPKRGKGHRRITSQPNNRGRGT